MTGTQSVQADDLRLLGIPRSRQTVTSTDPWHDTGWRLPTHFSVGGPTSKAALGKHAHRVSVVRVRPRTS